MLISKPTGKPVVASQAERLEKLLSSHEKKLALEAFYIERQEIEPLLEILPAQNDLIEAIAKLFPALTLSKEHKIKIQARLKAADGLRESNRTALAKLMEAMQLEIEQINQARQRLRQLKQLSKSIYSSTAAGTLRDWA